MNIPVAAVQPQNHELVSRPLSGWLMLAITFGLYLGAVFSLLQGMRGQGGSLIVTAIAAFTVAAFISCGFFTLQPNEAAVLILFGHYRGTVRDSGFFFTNPFNKRLKISLRA